MVLAILLVLGANALAGTLSDVKVRPPERFKSRSDNCHEKIDKVGSDSTKGQPATTSQYGIGHVSGDMGDISKQAQDDFGQSVSTSGRGSFSTALSAAEKMAGGLSSAGDDALGLTKEVIGTLPGNFTVMSSDNQADLDSGGGR